MIPGQYTYRPIGGQAVESKEDDPVLIKKPGDYVYYDAIISNVTRHAFASGDQSAPQFREIRKTPIFNGSPTDWTVSVVRFDIPSQTLPIQIVPAGNIIDNKVYTDYFIGISYGDSLDVEQVPWVPQNATAPVPTLPFPEDSTLQFADYWGLYSYQHMVNLINKAIKTASDWMVANAPGFPTTEAPVMSYDGTTQLFSINYPEAYLSSNDTPVYLYFIGELMNNFRGTFDAIDYGLFGYQSFGPTFQWQLQVVDMLKNQEIIPYPSISPRGLTYNMSQEYPALQLWYSLAAVVITTASLPVVNEWISNFSNSSSPDISTFAAVMADFQIQYGDGAELRRSIQYLPTAEYRRITMQSEDPITVVDLQIWWRTKISSKLIPILIPTNNQISVKLLFEKK